MSTSALIAGTSAVLARLMTVCTSREHISLPRPDGRSDRAGTLRTCPRSRPRPVRSPWSRSAAPATRSTPKSSPPGSAAAAGRSPTADAAEVVVVNTCGFIDAAKKDSIDTLLAAADTGKKVVAVGCLAERYGRELAASLPEADAVLGFDAYADIAARLDDVAAGVAIAPHTPADRRRLLPVDPGPPARPPQPRSPCPGTAGCRPRRTRTRLAGGPVAYLKLASGCDRRCSFCAIPSFRGSFVSRPPADCSPRRSWLAATGARELVLVSENSTSYGKDLGDLRALETLLPELAAIDGIDRVRVSYLQPAELRPSLLEVIATTPGVAPVLRPVLPARERAGAAPDEALRLDRLVPRPARPGPRARAGRRRPQQRHRRLPRRDRGRRRRARAVPAARPASTPSASSATPTRTAPRRSTCPTRSHPDEIADRVAGSPPWSTSWSRSGPRTGSARGSTC